MAEQLRCVSIESQHWIFIPETSWEDIDEPGAYVEVGTGDLYRMPREALQADNSSLIRKKSIRNSRLVQIRRRGDVLRKSCREGKGVSFGLYPDEGQGGKPKGERRK